MCPPASIPLADVLDEYSTDEVVFKSLMQFKSGYSLPLNVLSDVDPYQFPPSNLPDNMWYFCSSSNVDADNGYWRSTGDACEIYSTPVIIGLRKTLQFYKGRAPVGQKTNWMMQEYTTTEKCGSKQDQDPRALYRVFLVDEGSRGTLFKSELLEENMDGVAEPSAKSDLAPNPDQPSAVADRTLESPSAIADRSPELPSAMVDRGPDSPSGMVNQFLDLPIGEYIGDFLELDDLAIPLSRSTSSADSSCMTTSMCSEDLFDSDALMRELDDTADQENQDSRVKLNLSIPSKLKEVVMQPTALESIDSIEESKPSTGQTSRDPTPPNEPEDRWNEGTSNGVNTSAEASSSSEGSSNEERKDHARRTKKRKMMKYLCFLAF
uniref:protein NTM1-like 9 n=1 Tax=Erigeron canadensis TaxID=72917 RepID=UPI001CB8BED7|nr:protein NTM1-like 9 [Erigeron canadensis]